MKKADTRMILQEQHAGSTCVITSDDTDVQILLPRPGRDTVSFFSEEEKLKAI